MIAASANKCRVVAYLSLFKAVYFILLSVALLVWPMTTKDNKEFLSDRQLWTSDGHLLLRSHFVAWDADYYLCLSKEGYKPGSEACAFYPLYPFLIRWVSTVTGGNDVLVGILLANLFSLAAFVLFFQMAVRRYGKSAAVLALLLLLTFPGSLFFQFIYTESLFFLLLMLLCFALERGYFALTLGAAFLLPLTRAVGIFCIFPLLWHLFFKSPPTWWMNITSRQGWTGRFVRSMGLFNRDSLVLNSPARSGIGTVFLVLAPILGWLTYFVLMRKWTGNAFEGIEAQKQFGVQSIHNLFDPLWFAKHLFFPTGWHNSTGSVLDRCIFILLIYCFPLIWKLDKGWCVWAFFLGVVPAVSGGFTSYTRFASVVFPLFIALGVFLNKSGLCWLRWLVLTTFIVVHLILVWRFVNFRWAG